MKGYVDAPLRQLVRTLRERYPQVNVCEARLTQWPDGFLQQCIHYQAPLQALRRCGLLTDEMLQCSRRRSSCGQTSLGEAFHLNHRSGEPGDGCWDLDICTESWPREPEAFELTEARRMLSTLRSHV